MLLMVAFVLGCFFGVFYTMVKGYQLARLNKLYQERIELMQELEDRLQVEKRISAVCKGLDMQDTETDIS